MRTNNQVVVQLVCQLGLPVRGVSPYSNRLLTAMRRSASQNHAKVDFKVTDYRAPYPSILHPGGRLPKHSKKGLSWVNPLTWFWTAFVPARVIHFQYWNVLQVFYLLPVILISKCRKKKVLLTVHNPSPHEDILGLGVIERLAFSRADAIIVHGIRGKRLLESRLAASCAGKIDVIPHGVESEPNLNHSDPDLASLGLESGRRYVLMFGNLRGYKGVDVLLAAWHMVVSKFEDVDLVIAGRLWGSATGPSYLSSRLLGLTKEANRITSAVQGISESGRVILINRFLSDEEIDGLIRISEFSVFPYVRFSSQSGAACHAAGMGCPVLVSDVGELPTLATDESWVVPPGDKHALARALVSKLALMPGELKLARHAQRDAVAHLGWDRVAKRHLQLYCSLSKSAQNERVEAE